MENLVIVTGAGSGIGQALTWALAERGYQVLGVGRRATVLQETQTRYPDKITAVSADISTPTGRQQIVDAVAGRRLTALVNNAAVLTPLTPFKQLTLDDWRKTQAINVEGPLFLTQALVNHLRGGRVLHISSGLAHVPLLNWTAYCTSKAALYMLYQCLNLELAESEIVVGSVKPGVVDTAMMDQVQEKFASGITDFAWFDEVRRSGQLVLPQTVAAFLTWLLELPAAEFAEQEWDIYEASHHQHWVKDQVAPVFPEVGE